MQVLRILFVCTVDQDKLQRGAPVALILTELQRNQLAHRLNLRRLHQAEAQQFCVHLLDESVRHTTIPATIHTLSEGNPFFIKELVLSLTKTGKLERCAGVWELLADSATIVPSSVQESIRVRMGQLSEFSLLVVFIEIILDP